MTQAIIRPVRLDDAKALHRHCYPDASLDDVRDYVVWCLRQMQKGWIVRLVAEVEGEAVGNAQLTVWGQEGEIGSLVVAEGFRRQGIARRLLTHLIAKAKELGLVALEIRVRERQPAILAFYQRLGFRPSAGPKNRLSHPARLEPVVHLRMNLAGR